MTNWLAGMEITADRLNDGIDATTTTTGLTAATDFTVTSFSGRRSGKVVTVDVFVQYTGAGINVTNPGDNITDTPMCTLPSGWRPPETMNAIWGSGAVHGDTNIATTGVMSLRTTSNDIVTNANIRVVASWITD
ncbi:hypothetical protein ACFWHF_14415 [Streptomyces griseoincarnatus]